jgi:receptor expression-enhancing protein 5/6
MQSPAAYFTFKALEHKGDLDVRNWAVYWTILALFTCCHSLLDCSLCWLPGYYFLKLGFMAALWHPNMQLAVWLYERSVGPLLGTYEVRRACL